MCEPCSTTLPFFSTTILSALATVDSRWAIRSVTKLGRVLMMPLIVWVISFSVSVSSELVASSKIRRSGFLKSARAMARRCRSPPESFRPPSPIRVSRPSRLRSSSPRSCAASRLAMHSSSVASWRTNVRLFLIVPANSSMDCGTNPTRVRSRS